MTSIARRSRRFSARTGPSSPRRSSTIATPVEAKASALSRLDLTPKHRRRSPRSMARRTAGGRPPPNKPNPAKRGRGGGGGGGGAGGAGAMRGGGGGGPARGGAAGEA